MSQLTDLIIVNGCHQSILPKLADGSGAPVICLSSNMFSILQSLAFLMTIQEKFGKLNHIKLAWIGPSSPLCNTILSVFPMFGVDLKIFCICAVSFLIDYVFINLRNFKFNTLFSAWDWANDTSGFWNCTDGLPSRISWNSSVFHCRWGSVQVPCGDNSRSSRSKK